MRTGSFSSAEVRSSLQRDFVCHTVNTLGQSLPDRTRTVNPNSALPKGIARHNVQLVFTTPDGRIFHTATGYRGPEDMRRDLDFAKALYCEIRRKPERAAELVRLRHQQHREALAEDTDLAFTKSIPTGAMPNHFRERLVEASKRMRKVFNKDEVDFRFSQEKPMLAYAEIEKNPGLLLGPAGNPSVSAIGTGR